MIIYQNLFESVPPVLLWGMLFYCFLGMLRIKRKTCIPLLVMLIALVLIPKSFYLVLLIALGEVITQLTFLCKTIKRLIWGM